MNTVLKKKLLLGITGSIAAYKTPYLIRELVDKDYEVQVVLTKSANLFVTKMILQAVSGYPVHEELFDAAAEAAMSHIALARWPHTILIAPASANFIAKLAGGFADDLLTTLCLASKASILIAPAMNQQMWLNPATQENLAKLKARGYQFLGPAIGIQACGEDGPGRMLEPHEIIEQLNFTQDLFLKDKKILITAGPTHEPIDPVRFIGNRSSGKMGYALAEQAIAAGAKVTLITGPTSVTPPCDVTLIQVKTAVEMQNAVEKSMTDQAIFISAAAVSDYRVQQPFSQKIKRQQGTMTLTLEPTTDILQSVSQSHPNAFIVGFAAETENVLGNADKKRLKKGVDLMIANDVSRTDIGFENDDNAVMVFSEEGMVSIEKMSKKNLARELLKMICQEQLKKEKVSINKKD